MFIQELLLCKNILLFNSSPTLFSLIFFPTNSYDPPHTFPCVHLYLYWWLVHLLARCRGNIEVWPWPPSHGPEIWTTLADTIRARVHSYSYNFTTATEIAPSFLLVNNISTIETWQNIRHYAAHCFILIECNYFFFILVKFFVRVISFAFPTTIFNQF